MDNKRIVVKRYGGPDVLELIEEPAPRPADNEVRIRAESAGVALADVMRREGLYPHSPVPPFTPGYDVIGIVDRTGEQVRRFKVGDRIGVLFPGVGGYSSMVCAPEDEVFKVPDAVDAAEAGAIVLNYVTAYQMLHRLARVAEGESILIHGASGGVGTALLELGRLAGLRMFGTASSSKHAVVSAYGAVPIDYRSQDFVQALAELAPEGIDAVFDPIGGTNWRRSFRTLSEKGRFVGYGYTSVLGDEGTDHWMSEWSRLADTKMTDNGRPAHLYSITALYRQHPDWFRQDIGVLFRLLEEGRIRPLIARRFPLHEAAAAHDHLERSASAGKIVLTFDE